MSDESSSDSSSDISQQYQPPRNTNVPSASQGIVDPTSQPVSFVIANAQFEEVLNYPEVDENFEDISIATLSETESEYDRMIEIMNRPYNPSARVESQACGVQTRTPAGHLTWIQESKFILMFFHMFLHAIFYSILLLSSTPYFNN